MDFSSLGSGSPSMLWRATGQCKSAKFSSLSCVLQVVARGLARVVVFEDDVRFEDNFRRRLERLMEDVLTQKLSWDLM